VDLTWIDFHDVPINNDEIRQFAHFQKTSLLPCTATASAYGCVELTV
jgi:hypothetical protein